MLPVGIVLQSKTIARLRAEHPDTWEVIGSPANFDTRPGTALNLLRFLWRKDYLLLRDSVLVRMCFALRWFMLLYLFFLLLGFVSFPLAHVLR